MVTAERMDALHYIYAIVPAGPAGKLKVGGLDEQPVRTIECGPVAAVASPAGSQKIRPSRANLSAHQKVVSAAHAIGPVLPVRFGTVMPRSAVRPDLLEPRHRGFAEMLAELEGSDEFRIKCRYLPDVALREAVEANRSIQRLRHKIRSAGQAVRQADRMHLGELVFAELERMRNRDARALMDPIAPHILAWEPIDDPSDDVALHVAVLVDKRSFAQLEAVLEQVAQRQEGRIRMELIGPLPPWDFSNVSAGAV